MRFKEEEEDEEEEEEEEEDGEAEAKSHRDALRFGQTCRMRSLRSRPVRLPAR